MSDRELPFWLRPSALVLFVAALVLVRFLVASQTGLVRDEAYYTLWSFAPAAGYLDHPPMIAWAIGLGRTLLGENEAGVRLFPVLTTVIVSLAVYRTGRLLLDQRTAGLAVIWYNLTVAGGLLFVAVPDAPSVAFWTLTVWAVAEFIGSRNPNWWLAAGIFAGLGLLSKYTNLFLGAGLLLFLLSSRERRAWLRLWQVWAGGGLALLVLLPNLYWNAERGWASFAFQGRRLSGYGFSFGSFLDNLGDLSAGQALAAGVFMFVFALLGVIAFLARRDLPRRAGLALPILTGLPMILYFIVYLVQFRVEANWLLPVWPMLSLVGAWAAVHLRPKHFALAIPLGVARWAQAPLGLVLLALIYAQALWQPFEATQAVDRTRDMRGWRQMQRDVSALAAANGAQWLAVPQDYGLTGELAAYGRFAGDDLPVLQLDERERYDFLPPAGPALLAAPALLVQAAGVSAELPLRYFTTSELLGSVARMQGEEELQRFDVYLVSAPTPELLEALAPGSGGG